MLIVTLTIFVALLEGINVGLLLPLLETLDSSGPEGGHWITNGVANFYDWLGIPFKLFTILLAFVLLILVMSALKYWRMLWVAKSHVRFTTWARDRTLQNFMHTDLSYFHRKRVGLLTETYMGQCNAAGGSFSSMIDILANLGIVSVYLTAAFLLSPALTAIALAMLLVVTITVQYNINKANRIGAAISRTSLDLNSSAVETLSGIHVVKSFILERLLGVKLSDKADVYGETVYQERKNSSQTTIIQEISVFAMLAGIALVGVSVLNLDFAVIMALLFVLFRLAPRVSTVNLNRQSLAVSLAMLHHVRVTMDETEVPTITSGEMPFVELQKGIELKDLSFSYNGGTPVLQKTGFTIEQGKVTAIAGTSGAGKTTLVDLILRHYDPDQGNILVDGVDLRELDLASWRQAIGVVSQDVFLFHDTVDYNISLGRPDVNQEDIQNAARQAYAHDFILQLPQGYDTPIGDRGWNLSGGQRQRIALARAILKEPEILILDEATSSLDSESEQLIHDYMNEIRGTCTLVVVAHRLSTIRDADRIVVLEDGKVVEEGDWDGLLANGGVFASYHRLQTNGR